MQEITISTPMFVVKISAEHETEVIKQAAFWLSLPTKCPKCSKPLILNYRTPQTFKYYELKCTGTPSHSVNLGEAKGTHNLYYDTKKPWTAYDPAGSEGDPGRSITPDPASRSSQEPTDHRPVNPMPPPGGKIVCRSSGSEDSAGVARSRNDLLKLIDFCKKNGIDPKIATFDVKDLNGKDLIDHVQRLKTLTGKEGPK